MNSEENVGKNLDADEVSAGIVIFSRNLIENRLAFLVLVHRDGHYDFPKGHVEPNETTLDAAIRETKEETGITNFTILNKDQPLEISYSFKKNNKLIKKKVVFYVGEINTTVDQVKISSEHFGYKWIDYHQLIDELKYKEQKELLKKTCKLVKNYDFYFNTDKKRQ
ncbi:MAG: NUDIX domain-containing protein [Candidatus Micrarchaeota archaeon]|nr:NUDIX domain-containing protein [Candidatus Micrarchaeota archaeon]